MKSWRNDPIKQGDIPANYTSEALANAVCLEIKWCFYLSLLGSVSNEFIDLQLNT